MDLSTLPQRPTLPEAQLKAFLESYLNQPIMGVSKLAQGMLATAYEFQISGTKYIVRISHFEEDFLKDRYAFQHFSAPFLPIAKILAVGQLQGPIIFAISEKMPGQTMEQLLRKAPLSFTRPLEKTLRALLNLQPPASGFGLMDTNGKGIDSSWKKAMSSLHNRKLPTAWQRSPHQPFFSITFWNKAQSYLELLRHVLPEVRYIVHGDFGFDNLLLKDNQVTAVLDWAETKIGDPLYDIAWLDFWAPQYNYGQKFQALYEDFPDLRPFYEERLRYYQIYIALCHLLILTYHNDVKGYHETIDRIDSLMR